MHSGMDCMTDLRDRLQRYYPIQGVAQEKPSPPRPASQTDISKFVYGAYKPTPGGDIFVAHHTYDLDHLHGRFRFDSLLKLDAVDFGHIDESMRGVPVDARKALFLDTETTGLEGGAGTAAFLIGVGYFFENKFRVDQFFMRDYAEERGMLGLLSDMARDYDFLVTFNGRMFDVPLLETRMILSRMEPILTGMPDLDLLFPSRRIWRARLDNCRLGTLERDILGVRRASEDVPGHLIPGLYFDFLNTGDPEPLHSVFYHNEQDVLTMAGLLWVLHNHYRDPITSVENNGLDLYSLGRYFAGRKAFERAAECFEAAIELEMPEGNRKETLLGLSMVYKRRGEWDKAVNLWHDVADNGQMFYLLPHVELAKFYEHRAREIDAAHHYTTRALDRTGSHRMREIGELEHRLARLERKRAKRA